MSFIETIFKEFFQRNSFISFLKKERAVPKFWELIEIRTAIKKFSLF